MSVGLTEALWFLGRSTGLVALVLFAAALALGVLARSGRDVPVVGRAGVQELHRTASLTAVGLIAVHVVTLLFDPYAQLRLVDLVVPGLGSYRPLWLALGTLALDLLVVITVVSLLRARLGPRVFQLVHLLVWAFWPLALLHGLGTGTDAGRPWAIALVAGCVGLIAAALSWRLAGAYDERGHDRVPREVAASTPLRPSAVLASHEGAHR